MSSETNSEGMRYVEAVGELERILAELESDEVDVDVLVERVGRAAELVRLCKDRIDQARFEVERIVVDLEGLGAREDDT